MADPTMCQWWFGITFGILALAFAFWFTMEGPESEGERGEPTARGFCAITMAVCAGSLFVLVVCIGAEYATERQDDRRAAARAVK